MSTVTLALVVAVLVGLARVPWTAGRSARTARLSDGCGSGRCAGGADAGAEATRAAGRGHDAPSSARGPGGRGDGGGAGSDDPRVDVVLVLDLLDVAVASGAALPRAVQAVGEAVGGVDGEALTAAARALVLGAGWTGAWSGAPAHLRPVVQCLADSWVSGAAPGPLLRAAADEVNRTRRRAAREAAGRLGVRLVLPLGLCLLPAFVLLGLVPVVLSLSSGLLG